MSNYINQISGCKIAVLGAGRSGLSVARLLQKQGGNVFVSDNAPAMHLGETVDILNELNIPFETDGHSDRLFQMDWWVISPGMPIDHPLIQKAGKQGIPIFGELEVASWFCQAPVIGITGSNGKSTTTSWIGDMIEQAGHQAHVVGNIGIPFSDIVFDVRPDSFVVLEVSNFQLESIETFHPKVAIFLNLTPDHLNRHGNMIAYGHIKSRIFENQTYEDNLIYAHEDALVHSLVMAARSRKISFGFSEVPYEGAYIHDQMICFQFQDQLEELLPIHDLGIPGDHNVLNGMAAALAARQLNMSPDAIRSSLKTFKGLTHRLEFVREWQGISWVNDSKATNVDSVRYALGSYNRPIILIAGGRDKDSDFSVLNREIQKYVKHVILIGEASDKMEKTWEKETDITKAISLDHAVEIASTIAQTGDVVLLSPACASFDMFKDYEDRGDCFKALVMSL